MLSFALAFQPDNPQLLATSLRFILLYVAFYRFICLYISSFYSILFLFYFLVAVNREHSTFSFIHFFLLFSFCLLINTGRRKKSGEPITDLNSINDLNLLSDRERERQRKNGQSGPLADRKTMMKPFEND